MKFDVYAKSVLPHKLTVLEDTAGKTYKAFLSGSIIFPLYKNNQIPGVLCVISMEEDETVTVLEMRHFERYDIVLGSIFKDIYDRFKLSEYAVLKQGDEELQSVKFLLEMERRKYLGLDAFYPVIRNVAIRSDTEMFSPLLALGAGNKLFYQTEILRQAIGLYDPDKHFMDTPPEIQALCLAINAGQLRACQAFSYERPDPLPDPKWKELFDDRS